MQTTKLRHGMNATALSHPQKLKIILNDSVLIRLLCIRFFVITGRGCVKKCR